MMQLQLTQGFNDYNPLTFRSIQNIAEADSFMILSSTHMKTDQ